MEDNSKPVLTFKVRKFVDSAQLDRDLAYSASDLTSAMMEQAALFARYGVLAAQASKQVDDVKVLVENTEAEIYRRIRDEKAAAAEKATEAQVNAEVTRHPRVIAVKKALNEAKQIEAIAKIAVESFRHRRDMLVQHGLISREEMKGELSMQARQAREEEFKHQEERFLETVRRQTANA